MSIDSLENYTRRRRRRRRRRRKDIQSVAARQVREASRGSY